MPKEILEIYIYIIITAVQPALLNYFILVYLIKFNDKIKVKTITVIIFAQTSSEKKDLQLVQNDTSRLQDCQKDICSERKKKRKEVNQFDWPIPVTEGLFGEKKWINLQ